MKLILRDIIPIIILIIILFTIFRHLYNSKYNIQYQFKDVIYLLFIIYIIMLLFIVTYDGLLDYQPETNLILFKDILRYKIGTHLFYKNILGNIFLFLPFGLFIKYQFNVKKFKLIICTFFFSFSIEIVQLLIGRVFDIDDILLNIIGSITGYFLLKIFY